MNFTEESNLPENKNGRRDVAKWAGGMLLRVSEVKVPRKWRKYFYSGHYTNRFNIMESFRTNLMAALPKETTIHIDYVYSDHTKALKRLVITRSS